MMNRASLVFVCLAAGAFPVLGCIPADAETAGTGGATGSASGGAQGSGGAANSGGATGSGGAPGSGGAQSSGGATGSGGASNSGGTIGSGGAATSGGAPGSGGVSSGTGGRGSGGESTGTGTGGRGTGGANTGGASTGTGGRGTGGASTGTGGAGGALAKFSVFMTSLDAMRRLSNNQMGFGGDLRFGEADGLAGADKICTTIAESSMPGAGAKGWRAFLSAVGPPVVNAIDRVGPGPWYDRMGRTMALTKADLAQQRPKGADAAIASDFPNEFGIPNHAPDGTTKVDNHDVLTGTGPAGMLYASNKNNTCNDWTNAVAAAPTGGGTGPGGAGGPWCGHSWPAISGMNWMSALAEGGCGPGVNLVEMGPPMQGVYTVGTGGGYGAIYCFALQP